MTIRVGINGFGRIGRTVARILCESEDMALVAVNDLTAPDNLAHLLKYDSVFSRFPKPIRMEGRTMVIGDWQVDVSAERDPSNLKWGDHRVDIVIESTGVFRTRELLQNHLKAGAPKVLLAVPPKTPLDATIVLGVNDEALKGGETLVSNASCTTNASAPVIKILHDAFVVRKGYLNTIHAFTNAQSLHDGPHKDWRRGRAALGAIIPTTTGAAKAVTQVIPALEGKLAGMAYRVPVIDGSIVDMVLEFEKATSVEGIHETIQAAAQGSHSGLVAFETDPIVSCDIVGNPHSSIFDAGLTEMIDAHTAHIACWYDNEYGYSSRLVDLARKLLS